MPVAFADPSPVYIHSSQQAEALRVARVQSLRSGRVHHAFHYNTVRQTDLWLDVFRKHSPVVGNPEFGRIYRASFARLAGELAASVGTRRSVHVIGLGAGDGTKEAWLLEALAAQGVAARFTAVDVSAELALTACRKACAHLPGDRAAVLGATSPSPYTALVCDLLSCAPADLSAWLDGAATGASSSEGSAPLRIFTFFGLFPNFDPRDIFPWLCGLVRGDDILLASAHLAPTAPGDESAAAYAEGCRAVLPQYDNAATRAWLGAVLADWGWAPDLSPLHYATEPLGPTGRTERVPCTVGAVEHLLRFRVTAQWQRTRTIGWQGEDIAVREGEPLQVFFSLRYTPGRFEAAARAFGLEPQLEELTSCREEGIWRLTAR
ncbi:hypothetical protein DB346_15680 [Verrucomicrobia bacterium LW23]|nr:hypothetical protein DB346_15680 [Verrucomicrobia bacterium LW23]